MITRIEIDGFKTFDGFGVDLRPFVVIFGPNASGKSNFFDAIKLLSDLSYKNLLDAFNSNRGNVEELIRLDPESKPAAMRFVVEILVEPKIEDEFGKTVDLKSTRLRYELKLKLDLDERSLPVIRILQEKLDVIKRKEDIWYKLFIENTVFDKKYRPKSRTVPYISTEKDVISVHQDSLRGVKTGGGRKRTDSANAMQRTRLSGVNDASEFPHVYAVKKEMQSWKLLHLSPFKLREPTPAPAENELKIDGGNLAAVLDRLKNEDEGLLKDISRDLFTVVKEIKSVDVEYNKLDRKFVLSGKGADGRYYTSRVLSDGTLRILALLTLKNDPDFGGALLFEEPENGVHPGRLKLFIDLLRSTATDFKYGSPGEGDRLKQVIVNSHSPVLLSNLDDKEIYLALLGRLITKDGQGLRTDFYQVEPIQKQTRLDYLEENRIKFSIDQVRSILETVDYSRFRDNN